MGVIPEQRSVGRVCCLVCIVIAVGGSLVACKPEGAGSGRDAGPSDGAGDTGESIEIDADADGGEPTGPIELAPLFGVQSEGFATSKNCEKCHTNRKGTQAMRDSEGRGVAFYDLWKATMMANAARDPFWRAAVSAEVAESPGAAAEIEDKCLNCHSPMAYKATRRRGNARLRMEVLQGSGDLSQLALDGVSCVGCHTIEATNLGDSSSFSGGFVNDDSMKVFGPHSNPFQKPMKMRSGYEVVEGDHIRKASLCGSCHTLYTNPIDAQGQPTAQGHFPEQTPFLEWRNSKFSDAQTGGVKRCQDCHEPSTDRDGNPIDTQIAGRPNGGDYPTQKVPERSPYGRHIFVGGNTLIPAMIRDHADALNPAADEEAFNAVIDRVERQLQNRTAAISIASSGISGGTLRAEVAIEISTGHKFPTGFPSRRAWVHLRVEGADGDVVFESGATDGNGRLVDASGDVLAVERSGGPIESHRERVEASDQVPIFQSVMEDASGDVTFRLMRAATYAKDNRLLPEGWSSSHPAIDEMKPVGPADDGNFGAGGDRVAYRIALPESGNPPYEIRADLYYQTLSPRFAAELFEVRTRAVRVFESYWREADREPVTVDSASRTVQ